MGRSSDAILAGDMSNRLHRRTAWFALLAILLGMLVPSVARAVAGSIGADVTWVEVCTAQGVRFIAVPAGESSVPSSLTSHAFQSEHCPFCGSGSTASLPTGTARVLVIESGRDTFPPLFWHAPRTLHVWSASHPRDPPSAS